LPFSPDQTALYSWFPTQSVWHNSGFNVGHWNPECKEWHLRHRQNTTAGSHFPTTASEWRKRLRMTCAAVKLIYNMKQAALDYLKDPSSSPLCQ
jgi:hypothetical protein